jgi:hypothetical protein
VKFKDGKYKTACPIEKKDREVKVDALYVIVDTVMSVIQGIES